MSILNGSMILLVSQFNIRMRCLVNVFLFILCFFFFWRLYGWIASFFLFFWHKILLVLDWLLVALIVTILFFWYCWFVVPLNVKYFELCAIPVGLWLNWCLINWKCLFELDNTKLLVCPLISSSLNQFQPRQKHSDLVLVISDVLWLKEGCI